MQRLKKMRGYIFVLIPSLLFACIAQKPIDLVFTESGKGAGIDSGLVEKTATAASTDLSSIDTTIGSAEILLEFTVKENGSKDGYPLQIKELRFTNIGTGDAADFRFILEGPGSNNTVGSSVGQIVYFKNFGDIIVPDGETTGRTYQVKAHVRSNIQGSTTDNQTVLLKTSPTTDFDVAEASSNLLASNAAFQQNAGAAMTVVATHLRGGGTFQFASVQINQDFPGIQSIYAQDINQRVDKDFNFVIQLSPRAGALCASAVIGNLTSSDGGLNKAAVQGVASWTDLKHDAIETIKVYATAPTATPVLTQNECTTSFDVTAP